MGNAAASSDSFSGGRPISLSNGTQARSTFLGSEATLRGDIKSTGEVVIAGTVTGEISSDSRIVIAAGGKVEGTVAAPEISIDGALIGDATATKSLLIGDKGEVRGDVNTPTINITSGAKFVGRCSMPAAA